MIQYFKIFMLCVVASMPANMRPEDTAGAVVATVFVTATTAAVVAYLAYRETNATKIDRANRLVDAYQGKILLCNDKLQNKQAICDFLSTPYSFKKELQMILKMLYDSSTELDSRYGSWLTPWNWTSEMRDALKSVDLLYQKTLFLNMLFDYSALLSAKNEDEMIRAARKFCDGRCSYPVMETADALYNAINVIKRMEVYVPGQQICIETFEAIRSDLIASAQFATESRDYEKHMEQVRIAKAAEDAAAAARAQASAQASQAAAQFEQASAIRERNRIERNR